MLKFLQLAFRNVFRNRRRTVMTLLMVGGADVGGDVLPVADAGIEYMDFVAVEVLGVEDLDVAETVADRALAESAEHEGKESADEEESGNASADHEQRHDGAAAIAEDVTKC